jgi:hypothetical protein
MPVDALDYAIHCAFVSSNDRRKPGVVIDRMRGEYRELLGELTSDQARSMRPTLGMEYRPVHEAKERFRQAVRMAGGEV